MSRLAITDNEREFDAYLEALAQRDGVSKSLVRQHTRVVNGKRIVVRQHDRKGDRHEPEHADPAAAYKALGTRAPAFLQWFGDWVNDPARASKVVDANGEPAESYPIPGTGSKVKDAEGKPIVVYHGTAHGGFAAFDKSKLDDESLFGPGFYFTEDVEVADKYQGKGKELLRNGKPWSATSSDIKRVGEFLRGHRDESAWLGKLADAYDEHVGANGFKITKEIVNLYMHPGADDEARAASLQVMGAIGVSITEGAETKAVYLNVRKPLYADRRLTPDDAKRIAEGAEKLGLSSPSPSLPLDVWAGAHAQSGTLAEKALTILIETRRWPELLAASGFDGITHIGGDRMGSGHHHRVWIAFEPNQIKAVDNVGTFDASTADIYKSVLTPREQAAADFCSHVADRYGVYLPNQEMPEAVRKAVETDGDAATDSEGVPKKIKPKYSNHEIREMGLKWVTAHPNGQEPGVPILVKDLGDEYVVVGGAKGKMNFTRFRKDKTDDSREAKKPKKQAKPGHDPTPEEQAKLDEASGEKKKAASALRGYIMAHVLGEGAAKLTEQDKQKITDHALAKAAELGLSDEATKEFVEAYAKRHEQEKKAAAQQAVDKAVQEALDHQAEEELTGVPGEAPEVSVEQTTHEKETGAKARSFSLTHEQIGDIAGLAAAAARAADTLKTMKKELGSGDARTIQAVELAYQPMTDEEVKQYAVDRYLNKVELAANTALVEATDAPSVGLKRHMLAGAADTAAGVASALTGSTILDNKTAKALGVQGAAQVTARFLAEKLGSPDKVAAGLRDYIGTNSSATAAAAVQHSQDLATMADEMSAFGKGAGRLMEATQANAKRLEYINEAQMVLGRAMGSLEAAAHVALALENGNFDAKVNVAGRDTKAATHQKAQDMGLERGDYTVTKDADGGYSIAIQPDAVPKLYREQSLEQYQADAEVQDIHEQSVDPDGFADWQPLGQSDRIVLEPYQKGNIQFWERQKRVMIGDEAGAGKTATALCGIAHLAEQGKVKRALVVVPKSVADQFGRETWCLDDKYKDQYTVASGGSAGKRSEAYNSGKLITVITHDQMRNDQAAIEAAGFDAVVIDEAHYFSVRNTRKSEGGGDNASGRSRAAREITKNTPYLMTMTGTPIKNDMSELHSLADWMQPGCLGTRKEFMDRFGSLASQQGIANEALLNQLNTRLSGVLQGIRLTTDEASEDGTNTVALKPNMKSNDPIRGRETTRWVDMSPEQTAAYKAEEDSYRKARETGGEASPFTRDQHHSRTVNNVNVVDHPKVKAMREDLANHPGEKAVIFANEGHSWRTIEHGLGLKKGEFRLLNGSTTEAQRRQYREEINDPNSPVRILIASEAANFGMNLQGASVLMNFDATDTYAEHAQRIARTLRKGQKRDVSIYNYRTKSPLEIKADRRIGRKKKVAGIVGKLQAVDSTGLAKAVAKHLGSIMGGA